MPEEIGRQIRGMARGGGINLIGGVWSSAATIGVTLLLARLLGSADVGLYAQAYALLVVLSLLALSGFRTGLTRFVAVHLVDRDRAALAGTVRLGLGVTVGSTLLLGAALWVAAPWLAGAAFHDVRLVEPLRWVAVTLLPFAFTDAALAATQGWRTMRPYALIYLVFEPSTRIALTGLAILAGYGIGGAMAALLVSNSAAAVMAAVALRDLMGAPAARPTYNLRGLLGFSMMTWGASIASTGLIWADTILLGIFADSSEVGVYNVATRLVTLATFVMLAANGAFSPRIADLYHRGQTESLKRTYAVATGWVVRLSLPAFVALVAFPGELLRLFGQGYETAMVVTMILAAGKFVHVVTGPCGRMLDMSGRPVWGMVDNVVAVVANVLLNLWLIPSHGIVGAAVAWALSICVVDVARVVQVWIILGMLPFDLGVAKGLVAAGGAYMAALATVGRVPAGLELPVGLAALVAIYVLLIALLGVSAEDRVALGALSPRRRLAGST